MLPPDLVAKLNECANSNLVSPRDLSFIWLSRFTTLVAVGLVLELPELVYELAAIGREHIGLLKYRVMLSESHMHLAKVVAFVGWFLIVGGVVGERVEEVKVRNFDTRIQECSDAKVREATIEVGDAATSAKVAHDEADAVKSIADEARADAKDALAKAQAAQRELAHAEADAANAQTAASKALSTADKAESRLTEALQRANELAAKLDRLTTPRHLFHKSKISSPLKAFTGTEYVFVGTCGDQECFDLVSDIEELLEFAGWKRIKGPPMRIGITQFLIHGDKDFAVDESVSTGITLSVETPNGWDSVKDLTESQLPAHIRAAVALNQVLALNVSPSENTGRQVGVNAGVSTTVRIDVGRKPQ